MAVLAVAGCAFDSAPVPGSGQEPSIGWAPAPAPAPAGHAVLGEFQVRVSPRRKSLVVSRLHRHGGIGAQPESFDNISIEQDGNPGTGTADNVELVTNSVTFGAGCEGGSPQSFCGNVTLRSFYSRPLNNAYVQVTSIVDSAGKPFATFHGGINGNASPAAPATQLDPSLGLWRHPSSGSAQTFLGTTAATNNGTRNWVFADPDGADTTISLRVVASLTYKDYAQSVSPQPFIDACSLPGKVSSSISAQNVVAALPFPFTFYGVKATSQVTYNRDGVFAFGGAAPPTGNNGTSGAYTFKNKLLPETPVTVSVSPAGYVFWDALNNSGTGLLCHGTSGVTPNQKFVITWKSLKGFNTPDGTTNLTFSAILSEGVDVIDYVYGTMTGAAGNDAVYPSMTNLQRAGGKNAVIGLEGPSGATNISTPFPAGIGGTTVTSGTRLRFTPIP